MQCLCERKNQLFNIRWVIKTNEIYTRGNKNRRISFMRAKKVMGMDEEREKVIENFANFYLWINNRIHHHAYPWFTLMYSWLINFTKFTIWIVARMILNSTKNLNKNFPSFFLFTNFNLFLYGVTRFITALPQYLLVKKISINDNMQLKRIQQVYFQVNLINQISTAIKTDWFQLGTGTFASFNSFASLDF